MIICALSGIFFLILKFVKNHSSSQYFRLGKQWQVDGQNFRSVSSLYQICQTLRLLRDSQLFMEIQRSCIIYSWKPKSLKSKTWRSQIKRGLTKDSRQITTLAYVMYYGIEKTRSLLRKILWCPWESGCQSHLPKSWSSSPVTAAWHVPADLGAVKDLIIGTWNPSGE